MEIHELIKPVSPNQVSMFAKLFCLVLFIQIALNFKEQLEYFKTHPYRIYGRPQKILGFYELPSPNLHQFILFGLSLLVSLLLVVIGIYQRVFICIAFICYFPYFRSILSLSYIQRKTNLIPITLLILAVSSGLDTPLNGVSTTWEIILVKIALVQLYFSAGLQKIKNLGWSWLSGRPLQAYLLENYLWSDNESGFSLAKRLFLCRIFSALTLLFELTFWIIIFVPKLAYIYIAIAICFHLGTWWTMRINYLKYLSPVYMVFFVDIAFFTTDKLGI